MTDENFAQASEIKAREAVNQFRDAKSLTHGNPNPAYVLAGVARMVFPGVAIDWHGVEELAKICDEMVESEG